jgi:phage baseplate assembly protein W
MADIYKRDVAYAHESVSGDLPTLNGVENLKSALIRRWITEPGTFVYRPDYGAGLLRFQNEPMTIDNRRRMARAIEEQTKLERRVESIQSITITSSDNTPGRTVITVVVKAIGQNDVTVTLELGA